MNASGKRILQSLACRHAQSVWVGSYSSLCTGLLMTCVWQYLVSVQGDLLGDCGLNKSGRESFGAQRLTGGTTRLAQASTEVVRSNQNEGCGGWDIQTWVRQALLLIISANWP